jgi:hypothetical protein
MVARLGKCNGSEALAEMVRPRFGKSMLGQGAGLAQLAGSRRWKACHFTGIPALGCPWWH